MKLRILCAATVLCCTSFAQAQWATLDEENSIVSYATSKLKDITEAHWFDTVTGSISDSGQVSVQIDTASINSALELRDDRIREFLYQVTDYPQITVAAQVDVGSLTNGRSRMQFPATVGIMGMELNVNIDAFVSVSDSRVTVSSATPVVVFAAQVGLTEGLMKLSELAGGIAIGAAVPVSFSLSFDR